MSGVFARLFGRGAAEVGAHGAPQVVNHIAQQTVLHTGEQAATKPGFLRRIFPWAAGGGIGAYGATHPELINRITGRPNQPQGGGSGGLGDLFSMDGGKLNIGGMNIDVGIGSIIGALGLGATGAYLGGTVPAILLAVGGAAFGQTVLNAVTGHSAPAAPTATPAPGARPAAAPAAAASPPVVTPVTPTVAPAPGTGPRVV